MQRNNLVVKANALIEASYRLTLIEHRIVLMAIAQARSERKPLSHENPIELKVAYYKDLFNHDNGGSEYEQLKSATKSLFRRFAIFHDVDPTNGESRITEINWVAEASYIEGDGIIRLYFTHSIIPFICHIDANFTRYELGHIANMTSTHAIRLYELLVQWGSVGKRELEIDKLRLIFLLGNRYPAIADLKKFVINPGVEQINEHSNIVVEYTQRKQGRAITHIQFVFFKKEPAQAGTEKGPEAKKRGKSAARPVGTFDPLELTGALSIASFEALVQERFGSVPSHEETARKGN